VRCLVEIELKAKGKDILTARINLATTWELSEEARRTLWALVDSRLWFVEMVTQDFDQQLLQMEPDLERELAA